MCKENADPIKRLVNSQTFSLPPFARWVAANPGRRLALNNKTIRPLTAYYNRNSFMPHCAAYALLDGEGQGNLWPIRWSKTGFVVGGFYKAGNGKGKEGNVLVVDFIRSLKTWKTPAFSIGTTVSLLKQIKTLNSSYLVVGSAGLIFKEQGREVAQSLDMTEGSDVSNMHLFSIEYRFENC